MLAFDGDTISGDNTDHQSWAHNLSEVAECDAVNKLKSFEVFRGHLSACLHAITMTRKASLAAACAESNSTYPEAPLLEMLFLE